MSIYKRGDVYWYKFMWQGKLVRESTKQGNDKVARQMEAAHRTSLAKGEVGIREKKPAPALTDFLKNDFVPFVKTKHATKPGTAEYYADGAKMVGKSHWRKASGNGTPFLRMASGSDISQSVRSLGGTLRLSFVAQGCVLAKPSPSGGRTSI